MTSPKSPVSCPLWLGLTELIADQFVELRFMADRVQI
jgi:hypothetical protein